MIFLIATVLSEVWQLAKEMRRGNMNLVRVSLEAGVNIMRKGRHKAAAITLDLIVNVTDL